MAIDPVCKMQVEETKAAGTSEYDGKTYYFCAAVCKRKFDADPEQVREVTACIRVASGIRTTRADPTRRGHVKHVSAAGRIVAKRSAVVSRS